ncbi:RNA polymerase sigma factor [Dyadobacter sp. NIV53]|uniref:RNA polymerase sigma factor n=1 Tax=Dyadobacter sp. NIV53 TaxID=2861765 RepID=UPI001C867A8D|nr:sigma-70 family RNA polymerase sigma factor [Dyadobacter sp. NIV53]
MAFLNEQFVLGCVADGDEKAFSGLFNYYNPVLFRFVFPILKSEDLAKDCCQEIFIKIWEDRGKLTDVRSFRPYLLTVGKNHSLNTLKKVFSEEKTLATFVAGYNDADHGLENRIQYEEYSRFITSILETLTPQSRQVFQLCRQQGKSYDEASEILGISRNVIKKHMVKSMRILRLAVERDLGIAFHAFMAIVFSA